MIKPSFCTKRGKDPATVLRSFFGSLANKFFGSVWIPCTILSIPTTQLRQGFTVKLANDIIWRQCSKFKLSSAPKGKSLAGLYTFTPRANNTLRTESWQENLESLLPCYGMKQNRRSRTESKTSFSDTISMVEERPWEPYNDLEKSLALKGPKVSLEEDSYDESERFSQYEPPSPRELRNGCTNLQI